MTQKLSVMNVSTLFFSTPIHSLVWILTVAFLPFLFFFFLKTNTKTHVCASFVISYLGWNHTKDWNGYIWLRSERRDRRGEEEGEGEKQLELLVLLFVFGQSLHPFFVIVSPLVYNTSFLSIPALIPCLYSSCEQYLCPLDPWLSLQSFSCCSHCCFPHLFLFNSLLWLFDSWCRSCSLSLLVSLLLLFISCFFRSISVLSLVFATVYYVRFVPEGVSLLIPSLFKTLSPLPLLLIPFPTVFSMPFILSVFSLPLNNSCHVDVSGSSPLIPVWLLQSLSFVYYWTLPCSLFLVPDDVQ